MKSMAEVDVDPLGRTKLNEIPPELRIRMMKALARRKEHASEIQSSADKTTTR